MADADGPFEPPQSSSPVEGPRIGGLYRQQPYDPSDKAAPVSSRVAMTNLVGSMETQKKRLKEMEEKASTYEAKAALATRFERDLVDQRKINISLQADKRALQAAIERGGGEEVVG